MEKREEVLLAEVVLQFGGLLLVDARLAVSQPKVVA